MKARPSFQFYPSDWLRDPGLRSCSLSARGLWIDMLCFMHESEPYGHLKINGQDVEINVLARMIGAPSPTIRRHLHELETAGVFSKTENGTIFSRRMVRDEEVRGKRGAGGYLSLQNPAVPRKKEGGKDTFTPSSRPSLQGSPSSSSSFSSSASQEKEKNMPLAVSRKFDDFWHLFPKRNGKRLGKPEAFSKFRLLTDDDQSLAIVAVRHYAESELVQKGIGIRDAHRWLRNGKGNEPWREWIEPESRIEKESPNGRPLLPRAGFDKQDFRAGAF